LLVRLAMLLIFVDDRPAGALVSGDVAQIFGRHRVEKERFALARCLLGVRLEGVARGAGALQVVVALREAEIDQLALVAGREPTERLGRRAGRAGPPPPAEQPAPPP